MWDHCLLAAGLVAACRLAVTWNLYGVCSARAADPPKQRPLIQGFQGQEHLRMSAFPWELQSVTSSLALELGDLAPSPASSRPLPSHSPQMPTLEVFIKIYCGITDFMAINRRENREPDISSLFALHPNVLHVRSNEGTLFQTLFGL